LTACDKNNVLKKLGVPLFKLESFDGSFKIEVMESQTNNTYQNRIQAFISKGSEIDPQTLCIIKYRFRTRNDSSPFVSLKFYGRNNINPFDDIETAERIVSLINCSTSDIIMMLKAVSNVSNSIHQIRQWLFAPHNRYVDVMCNCALFIFGVKMRSKVIGRCVPDVVRLICKMAIICTTESLKLDPTLDLKVTINNNSIVIRNWGSAVDTLGEHSIAIGYNKVINNDNGQILIGTGNRA
jgi:hypothetical protein